MKNEIKNHWQTWIFLVSIGIILIIIYKALDSIGYLGTWIGNFLRVISPLLVGLLIAYLLYLPERKMEIKYKKSKIRLFRKNARFFGILSTYILAIFIIFFIIKVIIPVLGESTNEFIGNLQTYYSKVYTKYSELSDDSFFKSEQVYSVLREMQNFDVNKYFSINKITGYLKGAVGIARGIFDVFVAVIISIYILKERDDILVFFKRFISAVFKDKMCKNIEKYFYEGNKVFLKFITGQCTDAIVVGILSIIALTIMKVKYAILLGFIIGLFNMIPYFGAIIAIGFVGLITFITTGFSKALIVLIILVVLQQIDANIINPKIIGDSLKISPILVILSVTVGGAYFGFMGMFLAVPIVAVFKILVNDYIDNKIEK